MLPTRLLRPQQDEADNKRQTGDGGKNQQQSASRKRHGEFEFDSGVLVVIFTVL